ncbi:MAG TPA: glycoside hydrolase family 43 protein, partial [Bacteroidales bacterium]
KEKSRVVLIKKDGGKKEIIECVPYDKSEVYLNMEANNLEIQFRFGETLSTMSNIGEIQSLKVISDNNINKFNGTGVGVYASSNGQKSKNTATYDWFEYKY